jgi:hypothetical protein
MATPQQRAFLRLSFLSHTRRLSCPRHKPITQRSWSRFPILARTTSPRSVRYFQTPPVPFPPKPTKLKKKCHRFLKVPETLPSKEALWSSLGLSEVITEDTVVYVCLQTLFKLVPDFDSVFRQILERNPNARIIFKQFSTPELNDRLARRLKSSIGSVVDRITILTGGIEVGLTLLKFGVARFRLTIVCLIYPSSTPTGLGYCVTQMSSSTATRLAATRRRSSLLRLVARLSSRYLPS